MFFQNFKNRLSELFQPLSIDPVAPREGMETQRDDTEVAAEKTYKKLIPKMTILRQKFKVIPTWTQKTSTAGGNEVNKWI